MRCVCTAVLLFYCSSSFSQDWLPLLQDKSRNYYEIRDSVYAFFLGKQPQEIQGFKIFKRWELFWKSKINPDGSFPDEALQLSRVKEFNATYKQLAPVDANWQLVGPDSSKGGYAGIGRVNCMGFHPTDSNTYYVGSASGGVWKTINGGSTYTPLLDAFGPFNISCIDVNPSNPNVVYVGGSGSFNLIKTIDGGQTWSVLSVATPVDGIISHHSNASEVVVAGGNGAFKSTNGGQTFTKTLTLPGTEVNLKHKANNVNTLYLARHLGYDITLYRSVDFGLSWSLAYTISNGGRRPRIAVSPANPNLIEIASINMNGGLEGIFRSTDEGTSFSKYVTGGIPNNYLSYDHVPTNTSGFGYYAFAFFIHPQNINIKFITSINTWRTIDNGIIWQPVTHWSSLSAGVPLVHADNHYLGYQSSTGKIFVTNDGGIYQTFDGLSWKDKTNGLAITQIYHVIPPPPTYKNVYEKYLLIGSQDNGSKKLLPVSKIWTDVMGGDGFAGAIDYSDSMTYYSSLQGGAIIRHSPNGTSNISNNINGGQPPGEFATNFFMNPRRSATLIALYQDIYRTYDKGNTWTKISNNLLSGEFISKLEFSIADTNIYVLNNGNYFMRSVNQGTSWTNIKSTLPVTGAVRDFTLHPSDPGKIYAIVHNNSSNAIWASSNGGQNWNNISFNLPNIYYNFLVVVDGTVHNDMYVNGNFGVFYRNDTMNYWLPYSANLPATYLNQLKVNYADNSLLVATFGRGLWKTPLVHAPAFTPGGTLELLNGPVFSMQDSLHIRFKFKRNYFNYGNQFQVQYSDSNGNFGNSLIGYVITSSNNEVTTKVPMPNPFYCGSGYRVRIKSTKDPDTTNVSNAITIGIAPPIPTISVTANMLVSSAVTGNQWYLNNFSIPGATGQTYTPTVSGTYHVIVTDNGCVSPQSAPHNFIVSDLHDPVLQETIKVYPNPNTDVLFIENIGGNASVVQIIDVSGKEVKKVYMRERGIIKMNNFSKGIYMVRITDINTQRYAIYKIFKAAL